MGKLTAYLVNAFRAWERSTRIAFVIGCLLLVAALVVAFGTAGTLRQNALIGSVGLIIALQIIFMWGNRTMVTAYTLAQRRYLAEDFGSARDILEQFHRSSKPDAASLTLLANTYRQLGMLDKSEEIVKKALALRPFDHFPLYSFGRTLLIKGYYEQAITTIQQALQAGAPDIVQFDLGEAQYRSGEFSASAETLSRIRNPKQEPFRLLMTDYLLFRMQQGEAPPTIEIESGIAYWQQLAARFPTTPYGLLLADDVAYMQSLVEAK